MSVDNKYGSPKAAREAAAEAQGFLASVEIVAGGDVYEIPQRGLLDDEAAERLAELEMETESWDREDDVTLSNGTVIRGSLKRPYRKNGKLIKPSYPVRVAIAIWGEDRYNKYKLAGGRAADVTAALALMDERVKEREAGDPKSVGRDSQDQEVRDSD